jgi:uncharacterized protein (TIGR03437 family)
VTTDGNINTIIGNAINGYSGDTFVANTAQLNAPRGVVVDSSGNVYIADYDNFAIRKATANTLTPTVTTNLDGTTTTTFNTNSIITTVAGNGTSGFTGDGNTAGITTEFAGPWGIALDSGGNLYIADLANSRIRKIASTSGTVSTIAGNGLLSFSGDGSAAIMAQLFAPRGVAVDAQGNLYIADTSNNRVRKVAAGGVISTIAGNGTAGFGGDGASAASAQLNQPEGLAVDSSGNLYIADFSNQRVRMVNSAGIISTVAGNGTAGFGGDGGAASGAELNGPTALAIDRGGNVYVADFNNNRVRKFTPGGNITTVAGNGISGYGGDGGAATSALLNGPAGVAVDSSGNLYIADLDNSRIREVSAGTITTFAGNGIAAISGDGGPVSRATLAAPQSLLIDSAGNLYLGDSVGRVRMISASGTITTIVGEGPAGYSGDGGAASQAQINGPFGLAIDAMGNLYIADTGNSAIRQAQPVGVKPAITAITNGASNAICAIAPGEVVTLYGSGLGPTQLTSSTMGANGRVPTTLAGTQILFNGIAAPILYTWNNQVGVIVPFGVTGSAQIVAHFGNQASAPLSLSVAAAAPGLFTADFSGRGQAVANNANGTRNSAATPASAGSIITLIAAGGGPTSPPLADGSMGPTTGTPPQQAASVSVTIGGQTAPVSYAGAAPGIVAGVMQINVTIPYGVTRGNAVPVVVTVGGVSSPAGVTIAVSN